jgi:hypothetical protein
MKLDTCESSVREVPWKQREREKGRERKGEGSKSKDSHAARPSIFMAHSYHLPPHQLSVSEADRAPSPLTLRLTRCTSQPGSTRVAVPFDHGLPT